MSDRPDPFKPPKLPGPHWYNMQWVWVRICDDCYAVYAVIEPSPIPGKTSWKWLSKTPAPHCRQCGSPLDLGLNEAQTAFIWGGERAVARYHSTSIWYAPSTWWTGWWELRAKDWERLQAAPEKETTDDEP